MPDDFGDRTEAPTSRRRQEARESGNVARSPDLTAAILLLAAVLLLDHWGTATITGLRDLFASMLSFEGVADPVKAEGLGHLFASGFVRAAQVMAPLFLALTALAIAANLLQVGLIFTAQPLSLDLGKLSLGKGLLQMFSRRNAVKLGVNLAKVSLVLAVAVYTALGQLPQVLGLVRLEAAVAFAAATALVYSLALRVAAALLVLAILDWSYQKWQHEQDLKMTKQEVKEEFKRMEGDPLVKQRRAKVARQLAMQRINAAVPKADVVVTNPTHFAVALAYEGANMKAPKVVAKGADLLALRIRQLAVANGVPIVERPPLARALYAQVEVGQEIRPEYYQAVAEVLAYVYRLSHRQSA